MFAPCEHVCPLGCQAIISNDIEHYNDVIMTTMESQITSLTVVYSTVYSDTDQRKHQSSASLAFVWGIHPVNSPHKWPVTRKMLPFDDVIMVYRINGLLSLKFHEERFQRPVPSLHYEMIKNGKVFSKINSASQRLVKYTRLTDKKHIQATGLDT